MDTSLAGNTAKVSRFQREFVYLRPAGTSSDDYVMLFDRVGVMSPMYSYSNTKLLFHVLYTPTVNGAPTPISPGETLYANADLVTATSGEGKLFIKVLAPQARNVRVVGGRGIKAFWVDGENYDWHWDAGEPQPRPINDFEDKPYGEWRIELEPADAALEHNFLTVLYPAMSSTLQMPATTLVNGTGLSGAHIADPTLNRLVLFSSADDGGAPPGTLVYSFTPTTRTHHLIVDLTPGTRYQLDPVLVGNVVTVTLSPQSDGVYQASSQGVLGFILDVSGEPINNRIYLPLIIKTG